MKYFYLVSAIFLFSNVFSQIGGISSQFCIGSTENDRPIDEKRLSNGYRIVLLASDSPISADKIENSRGLSDFWVLCLNSNDQILWQRTIGGEYVDWPTALLITNDQSIYVCGFTLSNLSGEQTNVLYGSWDAWMIKMNGSGDIIWNKNYGGSESDYFTDLIELPSGNILVFGQSTSGISGNKTSINYGQEDIWSLTLNPNGEILNDWTIGGNNIDQWPFAIQTAPNQIKLAAQTYSDISGLKTEPNYGMGDVWVLDLDTNGNILHQKTIGGSDDDNPMDILWSQDGKLILLAESSSNQSGIKTENSHGLTDNWILKLDASLNIEQQKTIGSEKHDFGGQFVEYPNGDICIVTNSNSNTNIYKSEQNIGEIDIWLYLLDQNFNYISDNTIGTQRNENIVSVKLDQSSSELHLFIASNGNATEDKTCAGNGEVDLWALNINPFLNLTDWQTNNPIKLYPNPTSNFITIQSNSTEQILFIELLDLSGKSIQTFDPKSSTFSLNNLSPGIYLLQINTTRGNFCKQIQLE